MSPTFRPRFVPWCIVLALLVFTGCGGGSNRTAAPPAQKHFPKPLFDGLWLGMDRDQAVRAQPIRPALTSAGKTRQVWVFNRPGEYSAELTFESGAPGAGLERIDLHFAPVPGARARVDELVRGLGKPEVERRKAVTNAYGDHVHDQFDTIWSDATQYVFLTERVPLEGKAGAPVYYVTVKKKELAATGPPTGYVPPPPPKGKDGQPAEEPVF